MTENIIEHLEKRGFIDQITSLELKKRANSPLKVYVGFDPTADSLHLGNLVGIIALCWFQKFGHTPVAIIGGATARIGDPSGKSIERPFLEDEIIENNAKAITQFLTKILRSKSSSIHPLILNNNDWYKSFPLIDFLRDVGKFFRLSSMLSKESVKLRLETEEGMSFTEFSYQTLQGYDFYHLYANYGVELQLGGSDQWGNITAGIEFTRKKTSKTIFGLTFPLITRSDGKKFGKSESGAIWLDENKLSPYQFYQYLFNMPDADVISLLKRLTFLDLKEIEDIEKFMLSSDYEPNFAQKRLAEEVTLFVHGKEGLEIAQKVTRGAAPGMDSKLDSVILKEIANDMPNVELSFSEVVGMTFADVAVRAGLTTSKGEANRLINNGGAYLNNEKILSPNFQFSERDIIDHKFLLISKGKKQKILIKVKGNFR
jgi:tyrosyl-tRNA synthetase